MNLATFFPKMESNNSVLPCFFGLFSVLDDLIPTLVVFIIYSSIGFFFLFLFYWKIRKLPSSFSVDQILVCQIEVKGTRSIYFLITFRVGLVEWKRMKLRINIWIEVVYENLRPIQNFKNFYITKLPLR